MPCEVFHFYNFFFVFFIFIIEYYGKSLLVAKSYYVNIFYLIFNLVLKESSYVTYIRTHLNKYTNTCVCVCVSLYSFRRWLHPDFFFNSMVFDADTMKTKSKKKIICPHGQPHYNCEHMWSVSAWKFFENFQNICKSK